MGTLADLKEMVNSVEGELDSAALDHFESAEELVGELTDKLGASRSGFLGYKNLHFLRKNFEEANPEGKALKVHADQEIELPEESNLADTWFVFFCLFAASLIIFIIMLSLTSSCCSC